MSSSMHAVPNIRLRIFTSIICSVVLIMTVLPSGNVMAGSIIRYSDDAIVTAIELCDTLWDKDSTVLLLASAHEEDLSDILCAAPLAGQEKAPILLTDRENLDKKVAKKIMELKPQKIYLLGDLSETVLKEIRNLKLGAELNSLHGEDSWATSYAINEELMDVQGTFVIGPDAYAEAVSISSFAAANRYQIVLADEQGNVPKKQLKGTVYIASSKEQVKDIDGAKRLVGQDRYETNRIIVNTLSYKFNSVWITSGENDHLIDAFLASPYAANKNAAIILSNPADIPGNTGNEQKGVTENSQCHILGDESIISTEAVSSILAGLEMQWKAVGTWEELKSAVDSGRNVFLTQDILAAKDDELWLKRSVIIEGQNYKLESRIWVIAQEVTFKNLNIELTQASRNNLLTNNAVVYSENNLRIEGSVSIKGPVGNSYHGLFVENTITVAEEGQLQATAGTSSLFEGSGIKAGRLIVEDQAVVEGIGGNGSNYSGTGIDVGTLILAGEPLVTGIGGTVQLSKDYNHYPSDSYEALNEKNYSDHVGNGILCNEFRSDPNFTPTLIARGGSIEHNGFKPDPRATGGCGFIITLTSSPNSQVVGSFTGDASMKTKHNLYYSVPYNVSGYAVYNHGKEPLSVQIIDMTEPAKERVLGATWTNTIDVTQMDDDMVEPMEKI